MRLFGHAPDAKVPFREGLFCYVVAMDVDADGVNEYLLAIRTDRDVLNAVPYRLALARHVGGAEEPTLLSRPVPLDAGGEFSRAVCSASPLGLPRGFLTRVGSDQLRVFDCTPQFGLPQFRPFEVGRLLALADNVRGPVNLTLVDLKGDGTPDLIGGCFSGYPDDYFPPVGASTDNSPWAEIVSSRFDEQGRWRGGQERGYIYHFLNSGTPDDPAFGGPGTPLLNPDGVPIEFFGVPSICPVDFDEDGDVDLICGQCNNEVVYLENIGDASAPQFVNRGSVRTADDEIWLLNTRQSQPACSTVDPSGRQLVLLDNMNLNCMPFLSMADDGVPRFGPQEPLYTLGGEVRGMTFSVPVPVDWDGDGDFDLITGSETGEVEFIENIGTTAAPVFAAPVALEAAGKPIRLVPGPEGSVQGPQEAMWGYTNPAVGDWDDDGIQDLILGTSLGIMYFLRNTGPGGRGLPALAEPRPLRQNGQTFVSVWRQRPCIGDLNGDGRTELLALDDRGRLTIYRKTSASDPTAIDAGQLLLDPSGAAYKLDGHDNRGSVLAGRTKLWLADVTGSGTLDVLFGIVLGRTAAKPDGRMPGVGWIENIGTASEPQYGRIGRVTFDGWPLARGRHTPTPCVVDLNGNGGLDMLVGIDDGSILVFDASQIRFES